MHGLSVQFVGYKFKRGALQTKILVISIHNARENDDITRIFSTH